MEKEYNELTQQLLAAGYTTEHFPDYVQICDSRLTGDDPLNNMSGGFIYKRQHRYKFVYKTGCGKYVMGNKVISNMTYMGVQWSHENDCPVIRCPYDNVDCNLNDERLRVMFGGGLCIQCYCVCHKTEDPYDYENSIEKADKEREDEMEQKYEEFSRNHNGRVCWNHMYYDERTREWSMCYEPERCARVCYSKDYCPVLGRPLDKKRGNVYYDVKLTYRRYDLDGTIFEGQIDTHIIKGNRYFDHPASMDICRNFVKLSKDEVLNKVKDKYSQELFLAKYHGREFFVEVLNIRAESKPSRDLIQDLEDIKAGIKISHESDNIKKSKEEKKARRQKAQEAKIKKLEKKLLTIGYFNLEEHSLDKIHVDKWLGEERIEELEEQRKQMEKEKQQEAVQLSLFDLGL